MAASRQHRDVSAPSATELGEEAGSRSKPRQVFLSVEVPTAIRGSALRQETGPVATPAAAKDRRAVRAPNQGAVARDALTRRQGFSTHPYERRNVHAAVRALSPSDLQFNLI
jgi:hypothetical protein